MDSSTSRLSLIRLLDPLFLVALSLLLLNDFVWKAAFHNGLTGKLSDFAGLYAFAWVGLCLFPRAGKWLPWVVAMLFALWKSPFSQPLIDGWNGIGVVHVERVVDMADLMAIGVIPFAVLRFRGFGLKAWQGRMHPVGRFLVLGLSLFAFVATSESFRFSFDETYPIDLTLPEAVSALNRMNKEDSLGNPGLSLLHDRANDFRQEGDFRIYLHHNKEVETRYDTTFAQIGDSVFIDNIHRYEVPAIDSIYVNPDGVFEWNFSTKGMGIPDSVKHCPTVAAIVKLERNGGGCLLGLKQIDAAECGREIRLGKGRDLETVLKEGFQANVVGALREAEVQ